MAIRATFEDSSSEGFGTRKASHEEMDLDITPMIDVTFLLLIFFMVTSTMQAEKDHQIPYAVQGDSIESDKVTVIMLEDSGSATAPPIIKLPGDLTATFEQLTQAIRDAKDKNIFHAVVRADGRIPNGYINQVLSAIAEVEGVTFSMGVRQKK